jgi:hypothetical protein
MGRKMKNWTFLKKRIFLMALVLMLVFGSLGMMPYIKITPSDRFESSTYYMDGNESLYKMIEECPSYILVQHKAFGGSHYAYTDALFEESTGDAATDVGTEYVFRPGAQMLLVTFERDGDRVKRTETIILSSSTGCIRDPDVSSDGTKCIFSYKKSKEDDFHIYEIDLTDENLPMTQLTFGSGVADYECAYLPNGDIIFSSTRAIQTVDCHKTAVANLYKMSSDGKNIVRLGYDQVHTNYPTVTEDGRVIYTRWDYNDRTQVYTQKMFQMNPDGTNQTELFGNSSSFPTTLIHTRQMPNQATLYASIVTGHHTYQAGKLCLLDVSYSREGKDAISFPLDAIEKKDGVDKLGQDGPLYQYPYPISSSQLLVSYCKDGWSTTRADTPFGLWLLDLETQEFVNVVPGDSKYPSAQVVAIRGRDMFVRPSMVDYKKSTGTYYIADVYQGEAMLGVERGTVKQIRVVALDYRAYAVGATRASGSGTADPHTPIATGNGAWDVKSVLGVATVYEDGSALFSVPSETPVYFQLLDENGYMIQTMRSWSTLMPNESYSCVGCHENNNTAPSASGGITQALRAGVEALSPDAWQADDEDYDPYTSKIGFDYLEEVQPILDQNCISCHNNKTSAYGQIGITNMKESGITAIGTERLLANQGDSWEYLISSKELTDKSWTLPGFDGGWKTGYAGFGDRSDVATVRTSWTGSDKWLFVRKTFTIDDLSKYKGASLKFFIFYDDTPVIYLNGNVIYTDDLKWTNSYKQVIIDSSASNYLVEGENVIAISLNQHTGGRYFDTSINMVIPDPRTAATINNPISLEGENIGSQRMGKYFPLSYLVLTGSKPQDSKQWVGNASNKYTNWVSSMSVPELIMPLLHGARKSNIISILESGHNGVKLTDTEMRTIAAWIDLGVPAYGKYDANNDWDKKEFQEAEEEQNKRNYYDMQNEYSRMALSGTLPDGYIKIEYSDYSPMGSKLYTETAQGIVNLYFPDKIQKSDKIKVTLPEGVEYFAFTLTPKMGESIIYCPDGVFMYEVPKTSYMVSTISAEYANTTNYITARLLTEKELSERRNLAENTYDYTNNSSTKSDIENQYPHASATSEWENGRGEPHFHARNAIDGFRNNVGHGAYPLQSWGPAREDGHTLSIDFGRPVNAEQLGIIIRYDFPHDTYFKSATIELVHPDKSTSERKISIQGIGTEQIFDLDCKEPITAINIKDLTAYDNTLWAAFTEVAVYGYDIITK